MDQRSASGGVTPDFAEFTLGRTEGATRGLHPGYGSTQVADERQQS